MVFQKHYVIEDSITRGLLQRASLVVEKRYKAFNRLFTIAIKMFIVAITTLSVVLIKVVSFAYSGMLIVLLEF